MNEYAPPPESQHVAGPDQTRSLAERVEATHAAATPKVEVTVRKSQSRYDRYWVLTIDSCPHCGRPHTHGGGSLDHPPALGFRLSHCSTRRPLDYELVSSIEEGTEP